MCTSFVTIDHNFSPPTTPIPLSPHANNGRGGVRCRPFKMKYLSQICRRKLLVSGRACLLEWLLAAHDGCCSVHFIEINDIEPPKFLRDSSRKLVFVKEEKTGKISDATMMCLLEADILLWCVPECSKYETYLESFRNGDQQKLIVHIPVANFGVVPSVEQLQASLQRSACAREPMLIAGAHTFVFGKTQNCQLSVHVYELPANKLDASVGFCTVL